MHRPGAPPRHADPLELARCAAGEDDARVAAHVASCPRCAAEVAELRSAMAALVGSEEPAAAGADCLEPDAIARLAGGQTSLAERERLLRHLSECERCRSAVAAVVGALLDPEVAGEISALERGAARRWPRIAAVMAAAALAVVLLQPPSLDDGGSVHRARSAATAPAPELLAPLGPVSEARVLRWRGVPGANAYRLTLYDADGGVLHETVVADTVAPLPASIRLRPGETYHWTAAARTGWDRWAVGELAEFTLAAGTR